MGDLTHVLVERGDLAHLALFPVGVARL